MSWLGKQFSTLATDDIGTLAVKGTVAFLIIGTTYVFVGGAASGYPTLTPAQVSQNLAPIGAVQVAAPPPPAEAAPATAAAPAEDSTETAEAPAEAEVAEQPAAE
ncbi:MAG: hypothetical protein K9L70_04900, partial [Thiohalocapsa sp.]|nr:hypothetical protein [Thiohalocapsa sp.]